MNGASGEVWAKISIIPNRIRITTIGINQNFFLIFKKAQNSFRIDNLFIY